jgi:hypothetical protein
MKIVSKMLALLLLASICYAQQHNAAIWAADNPPGWPTIFTVTNAVEAGISANAQFTWSFSGINNPRCTVNGRANVDCIGRVIDFVFPDDQTYTVTVTISDRSARPLVLTRELQIRPIDQFPVAVRSEIRSVSMRQWTGVYVPALYQIKNLGVFDHLQAIHRVSLSINVAGQRSSVHSSPAFLVWHRALMRILERSLQVAANSPTLGLPYFDWRKRFDGMTPYFGYVIFS